MVTLPSTATWGPTSGIKIDVARLQADVFGLVSMQQQIVEIEVGDGLAAALHLNVAQAALRKRSTRGKQGIQKRAQRSDGIAAWLPRLADDEDLDGSQLPEIHVEIEVAVDASNLRLQEVAQLGKLQSGHMDGAHLRQRDGAGAVHDEGATLVYLAPDLKPQLVARTNDVVRRDRDIVDRRKCRGRELNRPAPKMGSTRPVLPATIC